MKKIVKLMGMTILVTTMTIGCQKEKPNVLSPTPILTNCIEYTIDGVNQHVTINNNDDLQALIVSCFDQVDEDHLVSLSRGTATNPNNEHIVTISRDTAITWAASMFNKGYNITMWYNNETNMLWYDGSKDRYVCIANKTGSPIDVAPNGHIYQPLQQYLQGNWRICDSITTTLAPGSPNVSSEYSFLTLKWEQIYSLYIMVPRVVTIYKNIQITNDTISYGFGSFGARGNINVPYYIKNEMVISKTEEYWLNWEAVPSRRFIRFRAYEWSQDTMLVFFEQPSSITPYIYTRVQ